MDIILHVHDHSHEPISDTRTRASGRLRIAALLTGLLFIAEAIGGFASNSLALLSDAGHVLGDLIALLLSLFSIHWASKPATAQKTYGFYRMEVLATLTNGALLVFIALQVFLEAIARVQSPESVKVGPMLAIAVGGLLVNALALALLHGVSRDHLATRAAFLHVLSDLLASFGVVAAGVAIKLTGKTWVDPVVSMVVALLILRSAYRLLKEAYDILMEGAPANVDLREVNLAILAVPGVEDIHDLHVWTISSGFFAASAHLITQNITTRESEAIVSAVSHVLKERFAINHTTFQVAAVQPPVQIQT